jgi:peroxiredoxin
MKKIILFFAIVSLWSCGENKTESTESTIKITCLNAQFNKVYLVAQVEDKYDTISEVELIDGMGEIPYSLKYPELVYLAFENFGRPLQVFADEDGLEVSVDFSQNPPEKEITGSVYNDQIEEYYAIEDAFNIAMRSYQPLRVQAQADPIIADILKAKEDSTYNNFKQKTLDFCYSNGIVGAFIANRRVFDLTYAQADSVYQNLPAKFSGSAEVASLKEKREILKKVEVGQPTIEINQETITGELVSLDETVKQNKYTLLYFWASWHKISRVSNVQLARLHKKYHAKGFEIYGVSLDEDKAKWSEAILEDMLAWPNVTDFAGVDNAAAKAYGVYYLPQSVLINSNGIIVVKNMSDDDLELYLAEKLN